MSEVGVLRVREWQCVRGAEVPKLVCTSIVMSFTSGVLDRVSISTDPTGVAEVLLGSRSLRWTGAGRVWRVSDEAGTVRGAGEVVLPTSQQLGNTCVIGSEMLSLPCSVVRTNMDRELGGRSAFTAGARTDCCG